MYLWFAEAVGEINTIILYHGGVVNQTRGSTISIEAPADFHMVNADGRQHAVPTQSKQSMPSNLDLSQPPPGFIPASNPVSLPKPHSQVTPSFISHYSSPEMA